MHIILVVVSLVLVQISTAYADDCESPETQAMMNECASLAFKKSDSELNAAYKQIRARLNSDGNTRKMLTAAQRAWVTYRDAECAFLASGVAGGSVYPSVYADCLDSLTTRRIDDFQAYLTCKEGDLSCPVPAD